MVCSLVSIYVDSPQLGIRWKKLCTPLDYWSRDMLNIYLLEKGLGIAASPHFVYDYSNKMFLMLHSINCPNFMSDCRYFLRYCSIYVFQFIYHVFIIPVRFHVVMKFISDRPFFHLKRIFRHDFHNAYQRMSFATRPFGSLGISISASAFALALASAFKYKSRVLRNINHLQSWKLVAYIWINVLNSL